MIEPVFVIALSFASWDLCWDFWHDNEIAQTGVEITEMCTEVTLDTPIRPQARPLAPFVSKRPPTKD